MKIVQVSDTHLVAPGEASADLDPRARLEACVADINANHADAAFCVLSGDLTDSGAPEAYAELREALSGLGPPRHLMAGNHDRREELLHAFPETPTDANGFVQAALETPAGRVLLLDTVDPGRHSGAYCRARAAWLAENLAAAGGRPVYLFMHHPPFPIGLPSMDRMRLLEPGHFLAALEGRERPRHLFFGHVHRPVSGSWRGIPFSALPSSTVHQVALDFEVVSPVPKCREAPTYAVILLEEDRTVVHLHAFLDRSRIPEAPAAPGRATG